jgi:3-hydroxybutyryl-CoA dehydrogenase
MAKNARTRKPAAKASKPTKATMSASSRKAKVPLKRTTAVKRLASIPKPGKKGAAPQEPVQAASGGSVIFLTGETRLVREYAELCAAEGIRAVVKWNDPSQTTPEDKKFKAASQPPKETRAAFELTVVDLSAKRENVGWLGRTLPAGVPILSSSVTVSATEQAGWIEDRTRLVGIGALATLSTRPLIELAPTIYSPAGTVETAIGIIRSFGKETELIQDRVGLVFPRLICRMINEAAFALAEEIATPQDLDAAIRLGLSHPHGPIEWTDRLGLPAVAAVLAALERDTGDPRYRTAPLLRQMALAGEWWKR